MKSCTNLVFQSVLCWTLNNIMGGMIGKWIAFIPRVSAILGFHPNNAANQCADAMKSSIPFTIVCPGPPLSFSEVSQYANGTIGL